MTWKFSGSILESFGLHVSEFLTRSRNVLLFPGLLSCIAKKSQVSDQNSAYSHQRTTVQVPFERFAYHRWFSLTFPQNHKSHQHTEQKLAATMASCFQEKSSSAFNLRTRLHFSLGPQCVERNVTKSENSKMSLVLDRSMFCAQNRWASLRFVTNTFYPHRTGHKSSKNSNWAWRSDALSSPVWATSLRT